MSDSPNPERMRAMKIITNKTPKTSDIILAIDLGKYKCAGCFCAVDVRGTVRERNATSGGSVR